MTAVILAAGVLGLLAIAANGITETRIVMVRAETTAARRPPVTGRAAVHHDQPTDYLGRHRR